MSLSTSKNIFPGMYAVGYAACVSVFVFLICSPCAVRYWLCMFIASWYQSCIVCGTGESCDFNYDTEFNDWINSVGDFLVDSNWCLDPTNGLACCSVISFGESNYYSDSGNVKVY